MNVIRYQRSGERSFGESTVVDKEKWIRHVLSYNNILYFEVGKETVNSKTKWEK